MIRVYCVGKPSLLYDECNPDWAPSRHLGGAPEQESQASVGRYERAIQRREKRKISEVCDHIFYVGSLVLRVYLQLEDKLLEQSESCVEVELSGSTGVSCLQTDMDASDVVAKEDFVKLEKEFEELKKEHQELEKQCQQLLIRKAEEGLPAPNPHVAYYNFKEEQFVNDDNKVRFFTGLTNWEILSKLYKFVHPSLPPFQQLMLTLMRLRLAGSGVELGYQFGIHPSTVSRIFYDVIEMLYTRLKFLIVWPERDVLRKTLPMDFRSHCPNCAVILDCFEIFIDRPSDLKARAQTYSSYKHHNTAKYLIGVSPQGSVSFITDGWGGRSSDKCITSNSTLLQHLIPGDTILADRGFDIQDFVGLYATMMLPAFTKGRTQLEGIEVEQTRAIANVRIHVERVIGNIRKKYQILGSTQPIDYLITKTSDTPLLDKMVTVCCSLINLCDSVVPFD